MLIRQIYIQSDTGSLVLRDVDGTEQSIPLQDALSLLDWLESHKDEIERALAEYEPLPPDEEV